MGRPTYIKKAIPLLSHIAWLKNLLCYMIHGSNIVSYYVTTGAQLSGTSSHLANTTLTGEPVDC